MYIAQIEAEVGRINFDIPDSVASHMTPKEYVRSLCFEELSMAHSAAHSYRMAVKLLNRTLHRDAGMEVKTSTLNEHVESMGRKATAYLSDKAVWKYWKRTLKDTLAVSRMRTFSHNLPNYIRKLQVIPGMIILSMSRLRSTIMERMSTIRSKGMTWWQQQNPALRIRYIFQLMT